MIKTANTIILVIAILCGCSSSNPYIVDIPENNSATTTAKTIKRDSLISQLPKMKANSLNCDADVYWKIVQRGKESLPLLIESLTDTTITNVYDSCKLGKLNVGEVSYFALEEIAEFPAFLVTHIQFDLIVNDCWNFYDYLFDNRNKNEYQKMVRNFYNLNKYTFAEYGKEELTACRKKYKIQGKYKWKQ